MNEILKNRKHRIVGFGLITTAVVFVLVAWHLYDRFSYSKVLPCYSISAEKDSVLTVGIIGDSWVEGGKLDSVIHHILLANKINNRIFSSGQAGARSKFTYRNLFKENSIPYSSKFIIENNPDYCIVVTGTGDAVSQVGKNNYSYHMILIIRTLLYYNIKPVIVELPEFGIIEFTKKLNFISRVRAKIYAIMTNSGEVNNIQTYRNHFKKMILNQELSKSILYINFNEICLDYIECRELYSDSSHLSETGNNKLGKTIVNKIIISLKNFV